VDEQQVLADRAREELRVLGDEADLRAQLVEIERPAGLAVVEDLAAPGRVEADEQLDEGRLARARGADEREGLAAFGREGDLRERRRRGRLVREADALEGERPKLAQGQRVRRFRL